jgi:hypothetical protein
MPRKSHDTSAEDAELAEIEARAKVLDRERRQLTDRRRRIAERRRKREAARQERRKRKT